MSNDRNVFLDILKGVLIMSVVLGHAIQYGSGAFFLQAGEYWEHPLMRLIYSVHMPLFMGISGYLSYFSLQRHSLVSYLGNRWAKLLPPILIWSLFLLGVSSYRHQTWPGILQGIFHILTTFWFLWSILICSSLVGVCEQIRNIYLKFLVYMGVIAIFACTPDILWWNTHKFMFICFLSGFYTAKYQFALHITWLRVSVVSVLWIVSIFLFHKEAYIYTSGLSIVFTKLPSYYAQIVIDLFRYTSAVLGTICVVYICLLVTKLFQKRAESTHLLTIFLSFCGKHSLAIYILSTYQFVFIFCHTKDLSPNLLLNMAETCIIVGICLGIQWILNKNKLLSRLIIGE